jgi:uncharacterized membrane protein
MEPVFTNDAVVLGILMLVLAGIFHTSSSKRPFWQKFYKFVPALLLCYFIPSILNSVNLVSGDESNLYYVASRYLLPASLVLLTLSIDLKGIVRMGPKAMIMTITATVGIVIGGPIAIIVVSQFAPDILASSGTDEVWRGLSTVAGSWIGGGANQTAMKEVFEVGDDLFAAMITVDVIVANIWMAVLLYGAGNSNKVDNWLKSDTSAIESVKKRIENYHLSIARIASLPDFMKIMAVGFGVTAFAHFGADIIAPFMEKNYPMLSKFSLTSEFFWIVVIATTSGLILSFTRVRNLEGAGSSKMGSLFLYVLVATIGMKMNIVAILDSPGYFLIGIIWMLIHITILITVGKMIKAPFFFIAVGSQSNIGGAASAPIVASAFHPSLATVGVLLAVIGYAIGTYGAWFTGILMSVVSP